MGEMAPEMQLGIFTFYLPLRFCFFSVCLGFFLRMNKL